MMNPEQLITHAKDRGIGLSVTTGFDLKVSAENGMLTTEVVDFLKENKDPIVDQLCDYEFQGEIFRIINPDDIGLVVKAVKTISGRNRLLIVRRYNREFDQGYEAEPNPVKKRNAGRYRANTWLLKKRPLDYQQ